MAFRVRSSKFRHVYGVAPKKELCYENIKISKNAHDGNFCAVNPKFFACVIESAGGGQFIVIPLDKTGRVDINCPKVCGHSGPVLDIKWNPFNDHIIASSSDDATIKVWQIPDNGLHGNLTEWMVDLHGHTRRVGYIEWHPTAENILLSAGYDYNCILWNTETAEPINIISCHQDTIFHIAWNRDGSLFATTCKDKKLRVIDPRQGVVVGEVQSHLGTKASKVTFLAEKNRLFTTGFSKMSERQIAVWDLKNFTKPLKMDSVDSSSGIVFPYFDFDTNVVFLAGKGDGNIRYFEIVKDPPYMHYLSQYQSGAPQRGLGVLPKRGVDTSRCEIMRFYKLHTARACCEPISMIVPRKSEMFQEDLFPPTASICASLSADEWISGQNRDPILVSLKDGQIVSTPKSTTAKAVQRKDGSLTTPTITTYKAVRRGDSQTGVKRQLSNTTNTSESVEKVPASVKNIAKLSSENNNNTDIRKSSSTENVDVNDKIGMFENRRTSQSSPKSNQTARQSWTTSYNRTISDEIPATNGIGKSENEHLSIRNFGGPPVSPSHMTTSLDQDVLQIPRSPVTPLNEYQTPFTQIKRKTLSERTREIRAQTRERAQEKFDKRVSDISDTSELFVTPPTSPATGLMSAKSPTWTENPLWGNQSVDTSALDSALLDFENTHSAVQNNAPVKTSKSSTISLDFDTSDTKKEPNRMFKKSSFDPLPTKLNSQNVTSKSPTIDLFSNLHSKSEDSLPKTYSVLDNTPSPRDNKYKSYTDMTGATNGAYSHTDTLPTLQENGSSTLDGISTDAPDDTLVKPSKLRASFRSQRKNTRSNTVDVGESLKHDPFNRNTRPQSMREARSKSSVSSNKDAINFVIGGQQKRWSKDDGDKAHVSSTSWKPISETINKTAKPYEPNITRDRNYDPVAILENTPIITLDKPYDPLTKDINDNTYKSFTSQISIDSHTSRSGRAMSDSPVSFSSVSSRSTFNKTPSYEVNHNTTFDNVPTESPDNTLIKPSVLRNSIRRNQRQEPKLSDSEQPNKIHVKKTWQPAQSPSSPEPMENGGHPTSITELRQAYFSQIKEIDALKEQLHLKERRIRQLEEELRLTGIDDEGIGESNC